MATLDVLYLRDLTPIEKIVLMCLVERTSKLGHVQIARPELAKIASVSPRSVYSATAHLKAKRYLSISHQYGPFAANMYTPNLQRIERAAGKLQGTTHSVHSDPET